MCKLPRGVYCYAILITLCFRLTFEVIVLLIDMSMVLLQYVIEHNTGVRQRAPSGHYLHQQLLERQHNSNFCQQGIIVLSL